MKTCVLWTFTFQGKLFSDSESTHARAEAAVLLKQLDFPVRTSIWVYFSVDLIVYTSKWGKELTIVVCDNRQENLFHQEENILFLLHPLNWNTMFGNLWCPGVCTFAAFMTNKCCCHWIYLFKHVQLSDFHYFIWNVLICCIFHITAHSCFDRWTAWRQNCLKSWNNLLGNFSLRTKI